MVLSWMSLLVTSEPCDRSSAGGQGEHRGSGDDRERASVRLG